MSTEIKPEFSPTRPSASRGPEPILKNVYPEVKAQRYFCDGGNTGNPHTLEITFVFVRGEWKLKEFGNITDSTYAEIPESATCSIHKSTTASKQS